MIKKSLLVLAIFLLLIVETRAQQTDRMLFYDVLYLKGVYDKNKKIVTGAGNQKLFCSYFNLNNGANQATIDSAIIGNPFFKPIYRTGGGATSGVASSITGLIQSAGSLDVTNFADGLAKFLVERTKQELSTTFFS
ncbi:MAG: hypothetical protein JWQ57_3903, partial [Mucilaginibacter sp.]|nr:hypothetical protein [Mucilaginibacter sp.]